MAALIVSVPREVSHSQLPPLQVTTRFVTPEEQDKTTGFKAEIKRLGKLAAKGSMEAIQQMKEVELMEAAARKRTALLEEVEDAFDARVDGKVLIFTGRHEDAWLLGEALKKRFPATQVIVGVEPSGGADASRFDSFKLPNKHLREGLRLQYMESPGPCVFVGTGYAYGTGLDWHDTDLLLIAMLPWSPGDLDQWIGRVWRNGALRNARVRILVASQSADGKMISTLLDKVPVAVDIVGQESMAPVAERLSGRTDESDAEVFEALGERVMADLLTFGGNDEENI